MIQNQTDKNVKWNLFYLFIIFINLFIYKDTELSIRNELWQTLDIISRFSEVCSISEGHSVLTLALQSINHDLNDHYYGIMAIGEGCATCRFALQLISVESCNTTI